MKKTMHPAGEHSAALVAITRFGLGPRPGLIGHAEADPQGFVAAQVGKRADVMLPPGPMSTAEVLLLGRDTARARRSADMRSEVGRLERRINRLLALESATRIQQALLTSAPFAERLAQFWSNHFAISVRKRRLRAMAANYEREAIRPHVFGRFHDMLKAVTRHPAMQVYLDNHVSTGPNSVAGRKRGLGLNENLAREILELHTLGVDGGYSQDDVTEFAKVLTGWRFVWPAEDPENAGAFRFDSASHEPGPKTILGKVYRRDGVREGEAVLADIARHPATARHIAMKLARHFVADDPPPQLVEALEQSFLETDGDLAAVSRTLATHDAAWSAPPSKFLPPLDFAIAAARAVPGVVSAKQLRGVAARMGQQLWAPVSPEGYPDDSAAWLGPEALRLRLAFANRIAGKVGTGNVVSGHAAALFGDALSAETRQTVARAESTRQGLTLLLMSPEFQRR